MPLLSAYPRDFRPCLRPTIGTIPASHPDHIGLMDTQRLVPTVLTLSSAAMYFLQQFTGQKSLGEIHDEVGPQLPWDMLVQFVATLDDALFLDGPKFREYVTGQTRLPSCIGAYPEEPDAIRTILGKLFTATDGPGTPSGPGNKLSNSDKLRAVLVPHMDYGRGGVTYGWGFKELIERTDASVFVIVATSHYSHHRFTLTRKNFTTPLGTVETDQAYVERLVTHYGDGLFADPFAHLPEHSIELEVLLLQYLLEQHRPFRIVPLLVGSFHDCIRDGVSPQAKPDIARMVGALQQAEAEAGEKVCYIISGDLAHIGPKFRDPEPVHPTWLSASRTQDERLLAELTTANPSTYFDVIASEDDARRICGLPPTWLTLQTIKPQSGRVLHYQQYIHPTGHESVSFAAAAFYE